MGVFLVIVVCLTFVSGNIQLNVVPNNIMNIWFPHKKGLALGWASMGLPICTATIILILNAIGNPQTAYIIIGIACFVVAVLSIFWAKDTPEEVGATPDNEPIEHFVTKLIMVGTAPTLAVTMLTVAAIVGIVGSYIWGWLDQKFGTKNASLIYGVWYLIALLLMIFQNGSMILIGLATFFVGFGIGGIGNLIPSIIGTCFGRFGFIQANRIIAPVNTAVRSTALIIIGIIGVEHLNTAYLVFFAFSVLAIILISFIKPKTYE